MKKIMILLLLALISCQIVFGEINPDKKISVTVAYENGTISLDELETVKSYGINVTPRSNGRFIVYVNNVDTADDETAFRTYFDFKTFGQEKLYDPEDKFDPETGEYLGVHDPEKFPTELKIHYAFFSIPQFYKIKDIQILDRDSDFKEVLRIPMDEYNRCNLDNVCSELEFFETCPEDCDESKKQPPKAEIVRRPDYTLEIITGVIVLLVAGCLIGGIVFWRKRRKD